MTDGKTTHGFSMNTVHPPDRDFLFTDTVTLPICLLMLRHHYPFIPFGRLVMLRHHYPIIPFGHLVMKRHHYPIIPCAPCSGKSRFDLVYILYILTVSTLLYIRASYKDAFSGFCL